MTKKQKKMLIRIIIAAVLLIALNFIPVKGILRMILFLIPYLVIGYDILKKAGKGILNRQVFDENFLMAVATIGAIAIAIYDRSGNFNEAVGYAVLPDRRTFPELCRWKEQKKYQRADGYPSGLCKYRAGWKVGKGRSG